MSNTHKWLQQGIPIMEKQSGSRTQDELQFLSEQLGDLQFFKDYIQEDMVDLLKRCVRFVQYKFYKKGETIFHIDEKADKFYIIISGSIGVFTRSADSIHHKKKKKKNQEVAAQQNQQSDLQQNNHTQSITSLKGLSEKDIQQEITEENNENKTKNVRMTSINEHKSKQKEGSHQSFSNQSSMNSIKNYATDQKRSLSPNPKSNRQIANLHHINKQDTHQQFNETLHSKQFLNSEVASKVTLSSPTEETHGRDKKYIKSKTVIHSPSKEGQNEGFFITSQNEKNKMNTIEQKQISKANLKETKQVIQQPKVNGDKKQKEDISKLKSIYENGETLIKAKDMEEGTAFGELALVYNKERAATIICLQDTHLAFIEKEQFIQIFSQKEQRKIQLQAEYIGKLPLFSNFSFQFLRDLFYNTISQKCKKGETIFLEGSVPEYVYIVKKGEFGVFKQFKLTLNSNPQNVEIHQKDSIETKGTNPLFHRKKVLKKEVKVMSVGEQEVIGDTDLITAVNRQFTLRCTSLEGELLVIKREYFEEKIFKYQDTFSELIKRCNNKEILFNERIDNIRNQLEVATKQRAANLYQKKERSFTNLTTDKQGIDRKLPLSPTQERNQYFDYHNKVQLHLNLQSKMEVSLPQIQTSLTPSYYYQNSNHPQTTSNNSQRQTNHLNSMFPQSARNDYVNTTVSMNCQDNLNSGNSQCEFHTIHKNTNLSSGQQNALAPVSRDNTSDRKQCSMRPSVNNSNLFSYSQANRSTFGTSPSNEKYKNESQTIQNYYEPNTSPQYVLQQSRVSRSQKGQANYDRSLQSSSESYRNARNVQQTHSSLSPYRSGIPQNQLRQAKAMHQQQNSYQQNIENLENPESNNKSNFDDFKNKQLNVENSTIQNGNITRQDTYAHYRSISQQDAHTHQTDGLDSTTQRAFYNNRKKFRQNERSLPKEKNFESSFSKEDKKTHTIGKQGVIPPLNLQEKLNKEKQTKKSTTKYNFKQNGSQTERISSFREDNEQIFMDSTYGHFMKVEQVAKEILTDRNSNKPLLIEVKTVEQNKKEDTNVKKKIKTYHQQPISQQEKILQTLIFSKKKVKKHLFSKIIGEELNNQQNLQLEQMYFQQQLLSHQTQSSAVTAGTREVIHGNHVNFTQQDTATSRVQEPVKYSIYNFNNQFDQQQQQQQQQSAVTATNSPKEIKINENNLSGNEISSVPSQADKIGIQMNNQQISSSAAQSQQELNQHEERHKASPILLTVPIQGRAQQILFLGQTTEVPRQNEGSKQIISYPSQSKAAIQKEKYMIEDQKKALIQNLNTYSVLKNNAHIFPEIRNFNLDSESKFIFESQQFLDPIRESQKYKIGSAANQNRYFRKSKQKMKENRLKLLQLSQSKDHQ